VRLSDFKIKCKEVYFRRSTIICDKRPCRPAEEPGAEQTSIRAMRNSNRTTILRLNLLHIPCCITRGVCLSFSRLCLKHHSVSVLCVPQRNEEYRQMCNLKSGNYSYELFWSSSLLYQSATISPSSNSLTPPLLFAQLNTMVGNKGYRGYRIACSAYFRNRQSEWRL
jgi:hypothetical protein